MTPTDEAKIICDGCNVRSPWEHRCHSGNCSCPDCKVPTDEAKQAAITIRFNSDGGADVLIGDWPFVHVNYDYRYTNNASRAWLAEQIQSLLLTGSDVRTKLEEAECARLNTKYIVNSGIAKKCAEEIIHLLGVGHVNDIDHYIDSAIDEATKLISKSATDTGAELLKVQTEHDQLRVELIKVSIERDDILEVRRVADKRVFELETELAAQKRLRETSKAVADGVWATHQKQFDEQAEIITRLTAELAMALDAAAKGEQGRQMGLAYEEACKELAKVSAERDKANKELRLIAEQLCGVIIGGDVTLDMVYHFVEGQIDKQSDRADQLMSEVERLGKGVSARFTAPIVCMCGSTRFKQSWIAENARLTGEGNIVLSVGLWGRHHERQYPSDEQKANLDALNKRKIDLCDWVWVLDINGYIGDSTKSEIVYAQRLGKVIRYLSNEFPNYVEPIDQAVQHRDEPVAELERLQKELGEAQRATEAAVDKALTRQDCPACHGSGWITLSEDGGMPGKCDCHGNIVSALRNQFNALKLRVERAELDSRRLAAVVTLKNDALRAASSIIYPQKPHSPHVEESVRQMIDAALHESGLEKP